jgi:hypothetical protein
MNKRPAFKVPLQAESRFHLRRYEQPHPMGGACRATEGRRTAHRRLLQQQRQRPPLRVAELQQRWPQGERRCNLALAHASCNRRAGRHVQATALPLAPLPRLHDCGTSTATRGDPAYDPAVPTWRDGRYGQNWAGNNGGGRRAGAAVTSSAELTSHPGTARETSLTT